MAKENGLRQQHLRQLIAQQAARMMAEDGIGDYALAKRKASRQIGVEDTQCLPSNAEILQELRVYQDIYLGEEQSEWLRKLRAGALDMMRLLERFNPCLTGSVLEGSAGKYAETEILLVADSDKDVEMFLLNSKIPYRVREKTFHTNGARRKVPVFVLEGLYGSVLLCVTDSGDVRHSIVKGGVCAGIKEVEAMLNPTTI